MPRVGWYRRTANRRAQDEPLLDAVPTPAEIFGAAGVFYYIASPPWITVGAGPVVSQYTNVLSPGVLDQAPTVAPVYSPGSFTTAGRDAAVYSGSEYGRTNGLGIAAGSTFAVYSVYRYTGATPPGVNKTLYIADNGAGFSAWYLLQLTNPFLGGAQNTQAAGFNGANYGVIDNDAHALAHGMYGGETNLWQDGAKVATGATGQTGLTDVAIRQELGGPFGGGGLEGELAEHGVVANDPAAEGNRDRWFNERVSALYPGVIP